MSAYMWTDRILGATIIARHAGEMINEITLAMVAGIGLRSLARVIHAYPTQAEAIKKAADACNRTEDGKFKRPLPCPWLGHARHSTLPVRPLESTATS